MSRALMAVAWLCAWFVVGGLACRYITLGQLTPGQTWAGLAGAVLLVLTTVRMRGERL